ncbi:MAG TPA: hypothetical protein VFU86_03195, partial [Terriglobales bacterium]|nr:hypothetical protein [Terriglobales bacterium]
FKTHVKEWQQQHANLQSVDLRYEHQVILNEDSGGSAPPKTLTVPKPGAKKVKSSAARKRRSCRSLDSVATVPNTVRKKQITTALGMTAVLYKHS